MAQNEISVELLDIYKTYADQLNISANLSKILHTLKDIKASGNEIEVAFRNILTDLLPVKYKVGDGHIVDKNLNVSKQYDLVITEGISHKPIAQTKDQTELYFYETVYSIGEIKATWNIKNLLSTIESIKDLRNRLYRSQISNRTIISGSSEIQLDTALSIYPIRNPLFAFAFAIKKDKDFSKFKDYYKLDNEAMNLPNITVILNEGIFVLINKQQLSQGKLSINLYPEFAIDDVNYEWRFINLKHSGKNFSYVLYTLFEHLSNTILEKPPYNAYSLNLLNIEDTDLLNLDEL
jgi:hypothetical protein